MTPSDEVSAPPRNPNHDHPGNDDQRPDELRIGRARSAMRRCWLLTGAMIGATGLALASCVPSAPVPPAPAPAPTPTSAAVPPAQAPADWQGAALTPGDWTYVAGADASRALFGPTNAEARFIVACEKGMRQVKLWRPADLKTAAPMTVTTTESARTLTTQLVPGSTVANVVVTLAPRDPVLDAMVFTRGRFMVQVPGTQPLYLPSWPEIARVVEDCR